MCIRDRGSLADATPQIALGALDGRYRAVVAPLVDHLSEAALNRERVAVEVEWLIHLADRGAVPGVRALVDAEKAQLRDVVFHFGPADVTELAEIERETVHDVKAVEYYLKRRLALIAPQEPGLSELVHFCCTSEDAVSYTHLDVYKRQAGYDGSAHRAREYDVAWLADHDLVLAADQGHVRRLRRWAAQEGYAVGPDGDVDIRLLREFDPAAVAAGTLEVDDPYYGGPRDFQRVLDEVEAAADHLAAWLREKLAG